MIKTTADTISHAIILWTQRSRKMMSHKDARQAVENVTGLSGYFLHGKKLNKNSQRSRWSPGQVPQLLKALTSNRSGMSVSIWTILAEKHGIDTIARRQTGHIGHRRKYQAMAQREDPEECAL